MTEVAISPNPDTIPTTVPEDESPATQIEVKLDEGVDISEPESQEVIEIKPVDVHLDVITPTSDSGVMMPSEDNTPCTEKAPVTPGGDGIMNAAPKFRLCHIRCRDGFKGFGFNLQTERGKNGQHLGIIDAGSPAESAGLKMGQKLLSVNGHNVMNDNHATVVSRIRENTFETRLLVADEETVRWFVDNKQEITHDSDNFELCTSSDPSPPESRGPDEIIASDVIYTTKRDGAVRLRMQNSGPLAEKPISIPTAFRKTVERAQNHPALAQKINGTWKKWTYRQYYDEVQAAAKSFIKLGLEPYHGVGIVGFNSPEWFISDLAAITAGGFAVGVYTTNSPEACEYVAANCEANIIVVENDAQLKKILKVWNNLPHLKAVVQYNGEIKDKSRPNLYTWSEFMAYGRDLPDSELQERLKMQAPNKACTLIYTSGTTGNPKGVMLSHDNLTWTAMQCGRMGNLNFGEEVLVSYLPLSHIAAQLLDIITPMMFGGTVYFALPDALKGSLGTTLKEVRPTAFLGVPRVWEKMAEKMQSIGKQTTGLKKKMAGWAKGVGYKANMAKMNNQSVPFGYGIAKKIVFSKIHAALGLERCKFCLTGAAPIMKETLDYFASLDLPVMELYGMSESTGPHTLSFPWKFRLTSVGVDMSGATTKLDNPDKDGNGEICMAGRHVFMGYLNMEDKTTETIDEEGWLHTGDIGKQDKDKYLYITGRIKELIITAGGENVAPVPIEDCVKEELPCISNCMLIGDKKKFLAILLTFKVEVDADTTEPLDQLSEPALDWCRARGSSVTTVSEILDRKEEAILKGIQEGIDKANKKAVSRAQCVQKWSILPRDFSIPGGELGPTLKLKRPVVSKMYAKTIDAFYGE